MQFLFSLTCTAGASETFVGQCCLSCGKHSVFPFMPQLSWFQVTTPVDWKWRAVGLLCVPNTIFLLPEAVSTVALVVPAAFTSLCCNGWGRFCRGDFVGVGASEFMYSQLCFLQWV